MHFKIALFQCVMLCVVVMYVVIRNRDGQNRVGKRQFHLSSQEFNGASHASQASTTQTTREVYKSLE
jgi:hypothetical protein